MRGICTVDGCEGKQNAFGLCGKHYMRMKRTGGLEISRRENGTGNKNADGYIDVMVNRRRTYVHILVAEKALGKSLPPGAVVHHVNEIKSDNRPSNLAIFPDEAYHRLIHMRMTARDACGHPDWRKCWVCERWDDPAVLKFRKNGNIQPFHPQCARDYANKRYAQPGQSVLEELRKQYAQKP